LRQVLEPNQQATIVALQASHHHSCRVLSRLAGPIPRVKTDDSGPPGWPGSFRMRPRAGLEQALREPRAPRTRGTAKFTVDARSDWASRRILDCACDLGFLAKSWTHIERLGPALLRRRTAGGPMLEKHEKWRLRKRAAKSFGRKKTEGAQAAVSAGPHPMAGQGANGAGGGECRK